MQVKLADTTTVTGWRKSSFCDMSGPNCLELAPVDGGVAIRNNTDLSAPGIMATEDEMSAFIRGVKAGEYDNLI